MINIGDLHFRKLVTSRHSGRWFARSNDGKFFLKVQDLNTPIRQVHNLVKVDQVMRDLRNNHSQCVPKVINSGKLEISIQNLPKEFDNFQNLFFQVTEYIPPMKTKKIADLFLSILELSALGFFPNDIKPNNLGWKDNKVYFLDFDQGVFLDQNLDLMDAKKTLNYLNILQTKLLGFEIYKISKLDEFLYNDTGKLNLVNTYRFKNQKSTRNKFNNYHKIDSVKLFAPGTRGSEKRVEVLSKYDLSPNASVLDIGANLGLLSKYFASRGATVEATEIDSNTESLGQTISIIEKSLIKYIKIINATDVKKYDIILLFSVLHHIDNYETFAALLDSKSEKILIECRLKESGKLLLTKRRWSSTNQWDFTSLSELESHLKKVFLNKKSIRFIGNSDKNRLIYELTNF